MDIRKKDIKIVRDTFNQAVESTDSVPIVTISNLHLDLMNMFVFKGGVIRLTKRALDAIKKER